MTPSPSSPTLRVALELIDDDASAVWTELTVAASERTVHRVRATSLGDAQRTTARSDSPVFVDVDVLLADAVPVALSRFRSDNPEWRPGSVDSPIAHPGTARSLAVLLWDIWSTDVADGVTLRVPAGDSGTLERLEEVTAILTARGVDFQTAHRMSA